MKSLQRLLAAFVLFICISALHAEAKFKRQQDVIYGRKFGTALTMDVFTPEKPNGYGIIWVVSGGWFSAHEAIPKYFPYLLDRGYTVFAAVHGSQPKFTITEIIPDMMRSVRFIRHNAKLYGIHPDKIGVSGGSAGGHLSLILATQGGPGDPKAKDPVDRESSAVQCVACFFPPTDFLNYGKVGENAVGVGVLKNFKAAFGPEADTPEGRAKLGKAISPIYFVHSNQAPVLIIHGDADWLVPIQQSRTFVEKCKQMGDVAELSVRPGKSHGWPNWLGDIEECANWYDAHLRGLKPSNE